MLEIMKDLPAGVIGVRARGTVTADDYKVVFGAILDAARSEGRRLRLLCDFGPDFVGFTPGAAWQDARMGMRYLRHIERLAVVTDAAWIRHTVEVMSSLVPFSVRAADESARDALAAWLAEAPTATLSHQLLADRGVLVLEPRGPLRIEDFDALSLLVDPWIESHGELHGLVLHVHSFPGWESLGGLIRHLRFVQEHHQKIGRIAVVGEGGLVEHAPALASHFVAAEVRHFADAQLEGALEWAASGHARGAAS